MSREALRNIIELVPESDIETLYKVIIKFVPQSEPEPDEIEAINNARTDNSETVSHNEIVWT